MITKVTAGATGALSNIVMDGFSSDNITSMTSTIKNLTTSALGNIKMDRFDPNNIPVDITAAITAGSNQGASNLAAVATVNTFGTGAIRLASKISVIEAK